jgi:hypothetical protein
MPYFLKEDPQFWRQAPPSLAYTQVFAEAVDHQIASFTLGADPDDPEAPLAMLMKLPPGWVLERHSHDCHRFEVVIEGEMVVEGAVLRPGDVSTSAPGQEYGHHMAGPQGCLTLEIFSRKAGMQADRDEPTPVAAELNAMIAALSARTLAPANAATSPVIKAWAEEANAAQPRLQREVAEREGLAEPTTA